MQEKNNEGNFTNNTGRGRRGRDGLPVVCGDDKHFETAGELRTRGLALPLNSRGIRRRECTIAEISLGSNIVGPLVELEEANQFEPQRR